MANKTVSLEIKRQASPNDPAVWESFELEWRPGMNVVSAMMEIAANPVTASGHPTTPVTYDSNCLEEICGSCAMRINGKARMACSALVDNLEQPIKVEPLSKFPLVRDLQVDRSVLFENLMAVKAWVPVDGTYDLGSGPRVFPQQQEASYPLSNCISCTCCMEVCPQFNEDTGFVGAATRTGGGLLGGAVFGGGCSPCASPCGGYGASYAYGASYGYGGGYTILKDWLHPQRTAACTAAVRRFVAIVGRAPTIVDAAGFARHARASYQVAIASPMPATR